MIVQCKKCNSKFKFDESKLKEKGIKVKCSVCSNIFRVYPENKEAIKEPEIPPEIETEEVASKEEEIKEEKEPVEEVMLDQEQEEDQEFKPISVEELSWKEEEKEAEEVEKEPEEEIEEEEEITDEIVSTEPEKKSNLPWIIGIVAILIVFILGGAVIFFMPDILPDSLSFLKITSQKQQTEDPGVALLSFGGVKGTFIQTNEGKKRFIIQGEVINRYPHPRSHIMVMGSILDSKGRTVRKLRVYAGNTFTEAQLKSLSLGEILKICRNPGGLRGSNINVKPRGRVPFMIVFEDLPDDMSEFAVEGVSSKRGK